MSLSFPRALMRAFAALAVMAASQAGAADLALVLGVSDYDRLDDVREARDLRPLVRRLERSGFDVLDDFDGDTDDLLDIADRFRREAAEADRVLILLDGHFVSSETDSWLLGSDARDVDRLSAPTQGLSLSGLARIAGDAAAGRAVILVGRSSDLRAADGLRSGTQGMELPQGVTLARGAPDLLSDAIFEGLLTEDTSLNAALSQLAARGFLSDSVGFTEGGTVTLPAPEVDTDAISDRALERGFWDAARALDTRQALELYIQRYPRGRFTQEARDRITAKEVSERDRWERTEAELNISRADRRQIQRDLTLLGYDTRGVDGIFGQGTRGAIERYQRDKGQRVTGFLSARLRQQIAADAKARRDRQAEEARRADDAFWQDTGAGANERGVRQYLERYPQGRHAERARARLEEFAAAQEEENRRAAERAWRRAQEVDTLAGYRDFLDQYPQTRFTDAARKRIRELTPDKEDDRVAAARAEEQQIVNNPVVRVLVERRLIQMGYDPGNGDGNFDNKTRRALKKFQRDRNIFPSGFVGNRTAAFLLTGR